MSYVYSEAWWLDFYKNLTEEDKVKVRVKNGDKKIRVGGVEVLTAQSKVIFPAQLAGKRMRISSHVVESYPSALEQAKHW